MTDAVLTARREQKVKIEGPTKQKRIPVVYFLRVEQDDYLALKIGFTADGFKGYVKRLGQHRKGGLGKAPNVSEICVVKGSANDEKFLHRYFAKHLIAGKEEEFHPHADVVDYVRWLRDNHFVWVPNEQDGIDVDDLPELEADAWLPRVERRKPEPCPLLAPSADLTFSGRTITIDDFYTHEDIIAAAHEVLGEIDLDPASHPVANAVVKAKRIFNKYDNGLEQSWGGRVWLNPPFSEWCEWVPKVIHEWESGRVQAMCILAATRTITAQYFRPIKDKCSAVCIFDGRIPFWGGKATSSPDDGHTVFYFGPDTSAFASAFGNLGNVYEAAK